MAAVILRLLFVKPCELCGKCCEGCCNAFSKCCGAIGEACDSCCSKICDRFSYVCEQICAAFSQPFSCCVFFTLLVNAFAFALSIAGAIPNFGHGCEKPVVVWMLVACALFICHCVFGYYLFRTINKSREQWQDMETASPKAYSNKPEEAKQEYKKSIQFFMEDYWMAGYIIVFFFSFAWSFVGQTWVATCPRDEGKLARMGMITAILMQVYFGVGLCIFFMTLCTQWLNQCECSCITCLCACCCGPNSDYVQERKQQRQQRRNPAVNRLEGQQLHPQPQYDQNAQVVVQISSAPPPVAPHNGYQQPVPQQQPYVAPAQAQPRPVAQQPYVQQQPVAQQPVQPQPQPAEQDNVDKAKGVAIATGAAFRAGFGAAKDAYNKRKQKQ